MWSPCSSFDHVSDFYETLYVYYWGHFKLLPLNFMSVIKTVAVSKFPSVVYRL
jgi:hypothetical protein